MAASNLLRLYRAGHAWKFVPTVVKPIRAVFNVRRMLCSSCSVERNVPCISRHFNSIRSYDRIYRVLYSTDLPGHSKVSLPALSPTMEQGSIVSWEKSEGEFIEEGDVLAQVETDKATMEMESPVTGYIAKILVPAGTRDIPLGKVLCVVTPNEGDVSEFKDYSLEETPLQASTNTSETPVQQDPPPPPAAALPDDLPGHSKVSLPALSPTMEQGSIVSWEKSEGEFIEEGDVLAQVETDKATMEMESPFTGYIAKILVQAGTRDIPLGKVLCIVTGNESDIAAFKDLQDVQPATSTVSAPPTKETTGTLDTPTTPPTPPQPSGLPQTPPPPHPTGPRVFASPYARSIAAERGVDLGGVQGTGYSGSVTSRDVLKATPTAVSTTAGFTDIPLSGMRKTIASRLVQSKQTVPHYYLTVDIKMDDIFKIRKELNSESKEYKLSVNDFIVKASGLALRKVPEVNSSWMETAIRRHHSVDISVAVSTEGGLITPIIFNADQKGLVRISQDTKELAEKARSGRLRPEEFQGGTFTISNLGMYGIKSFSAVINPPQACILAVGGAERKPVVNDDSELGFSMSNVMSVTLSCDHRVVDGAVGAEWLAALKKTLEQPYSMLL